MKIFIIFLIFLIFSLALHTSVAVVPRLNGPKYIASTIVPIKRRFIFYLKTSRSPSFGTDWQFARWQKRDMWGMLSPLVKEGMWLRNRGGSKTRDGVVLAIFLAYQKRNIMHYDQKGNSKIVGKAWNRVVWFAAGEQQLEQALDYFRESRYVKAAYSKNVYLLNGNKIKIRVCTMKQANSPRADFVFFDEEQDMDPKIYGRILGTMATSPNAKRLHMGTTEVDSQLHDNFLRLNPLGLVMERHIDECVWTTEEEALEMFAGRPQFEIDSQLYCKWVRPGGLIFTDIEVRELTEEEQAMVLPIKYYGMDPNPKSGHALVGTRYLRDYENPYAIYVGEEVGSKELERFYIGEDKKDTRLMAEWVFDHLNYMAYFEIEGQHGEEIYKTIEELVIQSQDRKKRQNFYQNVDLYYWSEEQKLRRVYQLRQYKIIIHPNCVETNKYVSELAWDPKEPKAKVQKTPDQHFADGFLHAPAAGDSVKMGASL